VGVPSQKALLESFSKSYEVSGASFFMKLFLPLVAAMSGCDRVSIPEDAAFI
jgi:hypothetical protein